MQVQHLPPTATPLAVIEAAQRLIADESHWTQNTLARAEQHDDTPQGLANRWANYPVPCDPTNDAACQWCALGAVLAVSNVSQSAAMPASARLAIALLAIAAREVRRKWYEAEHVAILTSANDHWEHQDVLKIFRVGRRLAASAAKPAHRASDLLLLARALIHDRAAYTSVALATDIHGQPVTPDDPAAVAWDALGALVYISGLPIRDFAVRRHRQPAHVRAMEALRNAMGGPSASFEAFANAHPHADVLDAFDRAVDAL